ncbi:MAG: flagellar basal body-associated FliL family protein [Moraxellaceae bacterium]|nr:flagellar basal body-associated FliL family protein [Moraxellaceae bacterium]
MAKEAPKKEEAAGDAPPKKSKKMLIIILLVVIVAGVVGAGAGLLLGKKQGKAAAGEEEHAEEVEEEHAPQPAFDPKKPPIFVALDPFTVNLQPENAEQFLQVVITLRVTDEKIAEQIKVLMPQIRHEMLSLMSSKKPSEVTTPDGRQNLTLELTDVANEVLGWEPPPPPKVKRKNYEPPTGPVVSVYFTQFIVQ